MLNQFDHLSLWEIAHRWHDEDPSQTNPKALPLAVQDTIRVLTNALCMDDLHVLSPRGVQSWNWNDIPSREDFIPPDPTMKRDSVEFDEAYGDFQEWRLKPHHDAIDGLEACHDRREFDRARLEDIHLSAPELLEYCLERGINPPRFWFSESDILAAQNAREPISDSEGQTTKGRHSNTHLDRELCRAIASTLWLLNPTLTIADIVKHDAIQRFGNGRQYTGKNTIRNWIKDLDPRPEEKRVGRPKAKNAS